MIPHHVYYQLAILGLLWLYVILHYFWPSRRRCRLNHRQNPCPQVALTRETDPNPSRA